MKLIIVERSKIGTFRRLKQVFADDLGVEVVYERRLRERRVRSDDGGRERRMSDRRRLSKPWNGREYIVIHIATSK
jgi:hypothetical protein